MSPCASATRTRSTGATRYAHTWAGFCEGLDGVSHSVVEQWSSGAGTVVEADVTYTRKDGSRVTVPVVTIYRERDGEIADYRIFIDLAPLFA